MYNHVAWQEDGLKTRCEEESQFTSTCPVSKCERLGFTFARLGLQLPVCSPALTWPSLPYAEQTFVPRSEIQAQQVLEVQNSGDKLRINVLNADPPNTQRWARVGDCLLCAVCLVSASWALRAL